MDIKVKLLRNEQFKKIKNSNLLISNKGRVYSTTRNRLLNGTINARGLKAVGYYDQKLNKNKVFEVSKLVMMYFSDNYNPDLIVQHKKDDQNNSIENLFQGKKKTKKGVGNNPIVTKKELDKILKLRGEGKSYTSIARKMDIKSPATVKSYIMRNNFDSINQKTIVKEKMDNKIIEMAKKGKSKEQIAKKLNRSYNTIKTKFTKLGLTKGRV